MEPPEPESDGLPPIRGGWAVLATLWFVAVVVLYLAVHAFGVPLVR